MEQLRVIGTEDGVLVVATEAGDRYTLAVDDLLKAELRRARKQREEPSRGPRPSPREIQAQIRAGLTAREVADILGTSIEDVARFEPPVLAEREFVVGQALSVPVLLGSDFDNDAPTTFGDAVRAKLAEAEATGERWSSWKEASGWIVKLLFIAGDVERDARWSFDPRRSTLSPLNADATQLSRQGSLPEGLIPRLRALDTPGLKDDSRFDSGAFGPRHEMMDVSLAPNTQAGSSPAVQDAAIKRAPDAQVTSAETADLLEALRRRRGQRPAGPVEREPSKPVAQPVALFDAAETTAPPADEPDAAAPTRSESAPSADAARRKGRTSMPSWDEIVFGARTDES